MRTTSNLPLRELTMPTQEPKGRFGWAAVKLSELKRSPLAVFLPSNSAPYQLALPTQVLIGLGASLKWATRGASITRAIRNIKGPERRAANVRKMGPLMPVNSYTFHSQMVVAGGCYVNHFPQ